MRKWFTYLVLGVVIASCSANKHLPQGEKYFEGHRAEYKEKSSKIPNEVKYYIQEDLKPESTQRIGVSRPGTWMYEVMGEPKKDKGLRHFIKYKLGKKPVYLSAVNTEKNAAMIMSKLQNNGYFRAHVQARIDSTKNKATVVYEIAAGEPYFFDTLEIVPDTTHLDNYLRAAHLADPKIIAGALFQKQKMQDEREMLARYFKNRGYYFFVPKLTYFEADSSHADHRVKLRLNLLDSLHPAAIAPYHISTITINLAAGSSQTETIGDNLKIIVDPDRLFLKPNRLAPFIQLKPGELYRRKDEEITLKQLNRLEVFEFVNIQFKPDTTGGEYTLSAHILANPRPKHSAKAELSLSTTSTNFTGPGLQLEYFNRNLFKGAEKLRITGVGRYEQQLEGLNRGLTAYDIDITAALLIPRVSMPVFIPKDNRGNVPSTKYRLQYRLYNQPGYYAQSSLGASFGFEWLGGKSTYSEFRVFGIDYVRLLKASGRLQQLFDDGILSPEGFTDHVIIGPSFHTSYSPAAKPGHFFRYYFGGSIETAGNVLYGVYYGLEKEKTEPYSLLNTPFAQFTRIQADFRTYYKLSKHNTLVLRQNLGLGIPYLNSSELPFSKQFFVGGTSSLRGFHPRAVGPGEYKNPNLSKGGYFDQTGDLLLELNIENRWDMGKYLKGALFVDAGNVWLKNTSEKRPGGEFNWDTFHKEIAVSAGLGLRVDIQFVVIRFDLAFPLRKPYLPEDERWVVKDIDFSRKWRKDNLVLNIAIGYPF